jgi:aminoglycoside 6'-N-acetyltransferase I
MELSIIEVTSENSQEWLSMAIQLWPDYAPDELSEILADGFKSKNHKRLLCRDNSGSYLGFIDLSLRHDYVEGCSTSPVGYAEGIFVKAEFRKQGVAKFMMQQGEKWSREMGCKEFASDTPVTNMDSQNFHIKLGFEKSDVIVHFTKRLE